MTLITISSLRDLSQLFTSLHYFLRTLFISFQFILRELGFWGFGVRFATSVTMTIARPTNEEGDSVK
jgi:hypothetical protein